MFIAGIYNVLLFEIMKSFDKKISGFVSKAIETI